MKIGVVYPQAELHGDPEALHGIGLGVERLGYDHLLMYDHVVGASQRDREPALPVHYDENTPFHEPLVAFGYLAAITRRIEPITGILILPQRQTVLVAKQAAQVDLLSRGRLRLGVASGWNYVEYDALGESFAERGHKLSEQIPYLRRLWSESVVSLAGRFDRIDRAGIFPRPRRTIYGCAAVGIAIFGIAAADRGRRAWRQTEEAGSRWREARKAAGPAMSSRLDAMRFRPKAAARSRTCSAAGRASDPRSRCRFPAPVAPRAIAARPRSYRTAA